MYPVDSVIHLSNNWGLVFSRAFLLLSICYPNDTGSMVLCQASNSIHFNDVQCPIMLTSNTKL